MSSSLIKMHRLYLIPLVHMSVCETFFYYYDLILEYEVKDNDASRSSFVVQDCFCNPGFFVFPCEIQYYSFKVCEKLCWDLNGDCIESVDCFR